jgi:hypothetical protein
MPNGNILVIVWERKKNMEAIAAGRASALISNTVWSEKVLEIKPKGTDSYDIVWEWHVWDHLVQDNDPNKSNYDSVAAHPELIDINYTLNNSSTSDWLHMNGIAYNPDLDQVMLTIHNFSEFWIIDHSTSTTEAASHTGGKQGKGGDLLYRWGNPAAYKRGSPQDQHFYQPHNAYWIPKNYPYGGKIMIFNNGLGKPGGLFSEVETISPPLTNSGGYRAPGENAYLPKSSEWQYKDSVPGNFYSALISGAQMLNNGNVLICSGIPGIMFEIDSMKHKVWEYRNPVATGGPVTAQSAPGTVFRCTFYSKGYEGFVNHTLTAGSPIERNGPAYPCFIPDDTLPPVVTIRGNKTDTIEVFSSYNDKGASAHSDFSNVRFSTGGNFYKAFPTGKPNRLGKFTVVYSATDSAGLSDSMVRTVWVVDRTAPVIHLSGDSNMTLCRWASLTDKGYTVNDNYFSNDKIKVDTFGTFNKKTSIQLPGFYTIRYRATDSSGNVAFSGFRHIQVLQAGSAQCKTGIEEGLSLDKYIAVYPNPSTGLLTVKAELPGEEKVYVYITNMVGQQVTAPISTDISSNIFSINLGAQPAGMYLVNVQTSEGIITKQVVLTK